MAAPGKYTPSFSFSGYQATQPDRPLPGPRHDTEYFNISESLGDTIDALADIRRDDGHLQNGIVDWEALDPDLADNLPAGATGETGPVGPVGPVGPAGPPGTGDTGTIASMSVADLKNVIPVEGMTVAVNDPGKEGLFQWKGQDYSVFMEVEALASTVVVAATGVITIPYHQLDTGSGVYLKTAVNGLSAYTLYWVIRNAIVPATNVSTTIRLATSFANAKAGVHIVLSGAAAMTVYRQADPHEGRFILKNGTKCDGSEGVWIRMVDGEYDAGWWGLDPAWTDNQAILTTALHACPYGATLVVPPGIWNISRYVTMRWREGQTLDGCNWQSKLHGPMIEHPETAVPSCLVRCSVSGSTISNMAGGGFTGQVHGEFYATDSNLSESAGVHFLTKRGQHTLTNVRCLNNNFYDLDTGVIVGANMENITASQVDQDAIVYYVLRYSWVEGNLMQRIRRQGIEIFCTEHAHVYNNTVFMERKGAGFSTSRGIRICGSRHFTVTGNRFYGIDDNEAASYGAGIEAASMSTFSNPYAMRFSGPGKVTNNYFENFYSAIGMGGSRGMIDIIGNQAVGNPNPYPATLAVTISVASPAVITWAVHLLKVGTRIVFTTSGTLPTGLTAGTSYYVAVVLSNSTFTVAATPGGPPIDTTGVGSGTHTCTVWQHSSAATFSLANPTVITWTGHGLTLRDKIRFANSGGALPGGVSNGLIHYVQEIVDANNIKVSLIPGGPPIGATTAGTGTHTATRPSLVTASRAATFFLRNASGGYAGALATPNVYTVTMTIATPCVVTWTAHKLYDDNEVSFSSSGALPTGIVANQSYFVRNRAANTFELSLTQGGASIASSGSQSGTHYIKPITLFQTIKPQTDYVNISDNTAFLIGTFVFTQGCVSEMHITNNRFVGSGASTSKFLEVTGYASAVDPGEIELVKVLLCQDNIGLLHGQTVGGTISLIGGRAGEAFSINRNRVTPGATGGLLVESGVATAAVLVDSPISNEPLSSTQWHLLHNPPADFDKFPIGRAVI